ncbi:cyclic nucleotide-binding protein [Anaerosporomusa subterranea]|uniref:Cyclic nucleotide-binding protein n=1 Tax=Anaerosporomusa subterranea TaxID=1794912 RepID=A0A154BVK9_ANASB|nr:cyclic nucleotide-binding domain-containing protein [Anaerosporomusa subterranea]KYZ77972.1 cyclic nucleotide-binding protein [Anaerosporomusa subterranea]
MNNNLQPTKPDQKVIPERVFTVGIASTAKEKTEIYQFRYSIYVEEMSRQLRSPDNGEKLLYDEMDEWGVLLYVKADSELIGVSRINIGLLQNFHPDIITSLSLKKFQNFYTGKKDQKFGLITKLMVSPLYRNSPALYLLMAKAYELSCEHRVQFTFGGCNFYLLRLYEEIGVRRFGENFQDPGYGLLAPVVWLIDDIEHMRKLHSPFYRLARKREAVNKQVADWFFTDFSEASSVINSQLVTEEELWTVLCTRLGDSPNKAMPILQGLSEADAKKFLHKCGLVTQCHANDQIITSGDPSNELNILLSGELHASSLSESGTNRILPGQHFGSVGLVDHTSHTQDIVAVTLTEILVLSRMAFPKFRHRYPGITNHVLENLSHIIKKGGPNDATQA